MRVTDGIICSTDFLARRYRSLQRAHVGVPQRHRPQALRATASRRAQGVTIGWAGGVGHKASLARWEPAIRNVLRARPETRFVSVGHGAAAEFIEEFGPSARSAYRRRKIEVYPASMTLFDIAIAPSAENNLFRGKSDLRWLEASALGHPARRAPGRLSRTSRTASPACTPARRHEVEAALLRLIDDAERARAHRRARRYEHVAEHRRIEVAAESWREVLPKSRPVDAPDREIRYRSAPRLPTTSVSHGRRQQEPYRASPPPPLSQFEVHTGRWRATHT